MKIIKIILIVSLVLAAAVTGAFLFNYIKLQEKMNEVLNGDPRNEGIAVCVHFQDYVDTSTLIYDLKEVSREKSRADVFRVLLQFAESVKDSEFEEVILYSDGEPRFHLKGDYFQILGKEYGFQNAIYTARTFPENVYRPDGSKAFASWTGGLIGVLKEQMDDHNDFHSQWWGASNTISLRSRPAQLHYETAIVTKLKYNQVSEGMSYEQVCKIVGERGDEMSRTSIEGYVSVAYQWKNRDGSNMIVMFLNGKVVQRAQFGLP